MTFNLKRDIPNSNPKLNKSSVNPLNTDETAGVDKNEEIKESNPTLPSNSDYNYGSLVDPTFNPFQSKPEMRF